MATLSADVLQDDMAVTLARVMAAANKRARELGVDVVQSFITITQQFDNGQRSLVIKQDERVAGLLTLHNVKAIPASDWSTKTAAQVMIPIVNMKCIRPEAELVDVLGEMDRHGVNQLPVMAGDPILGALGRDDVISFLRTVSEFSHH
jgi:CBS domain-containing protein